VSVTRQVDAARRFEPTEHYAEWRQGCPLHHEVDHEPPFYVVTRFSDVLDVLKHPELWSNRDGPGVQYHEPGVLGSADDPDHGRHRRVLRTSFVPTAIKRLEPQLRATADRLIDTFVDAGECDFARQFAAPFPALAIAELLGIHGDDRADFGRWSDQAVAALTGGDLVTYYRAKQALEDHVEAGCDARATQLAAGSEIPDDVLSVLTLARREGTLANQEVRHLGYQLLVAGHETTTSLLGMLLYRLLEQPALMTTIREDFDLIPVAVEEALRFDSPVHGLFRTNAEECVVHGETIPPRTKLQVCYAAANRDPEQFAAPDAFQLDRERGELGRHVAFGWGIHFCIGAPLARLEAKVAFEQLLGRLAHIELAGEPTRNDSFVLHGLTSLPIRFEPIQFVKLV
jgi:cytochrome P450